MTEWTDGLSMPASMKDGGNMSYTIAFANQKGGVAKTTTTVSVGGAFVKAGHQVLLLDLDPQGDMTLALGFDPKYIRGSIADVLLNSSSLPSMIRETNLPGLDLVPSNYDMLLADQFLPVRQNYESILRNVITGHLSSSTYDYILLDCPPSMGAITFNALTAANLLIIPTQPEYFSAYAIKNMLSAIRKVRSYSNPSLQYRILITMQDCRNRIHRNFSEELRSTFGHSLMQSVIDVDTKLRESSVVGVPITHYISRTRSALQYQALAQELTHNVQEKINQLTA